MSSSLSPLAEHPIVIPALQFPICMTQAVIDNIDVGTYVSVRAGPGLDWAEKDRITNGDAFWIARVQPYVQNGYIAIIYNREASNRYLCDVSIRSETITYTGPCFYGWILDTRAYRVVSG